MRTAAACLLALIGSAAALAAEGDADGGPRLLSVAEFLALVDDKTAHFTVRGEYYGSEAYHPNRRSVWRDAYRACEEGYWVSVGEQLCFQYDSVSCWRVYETAEGGHYAVSDGGFRVDFERIEPGAFDCQGIPLG